MALELWEYLLRLTLSALFGGLIGLERELRMKGAGIRTHLLVSFAACTMTLVSKYGFFDVIDYPDIRLDPSRIAAGLVTAIGFLGAGTIFARGRSVSGLTTAAGLWATVGIGMTTGAGMYPVSAVGTVFLVVVQAALHRDHDVLGTAAGVLQIQIDDRPEALTGVMAELSVLGLEPRSCKYERSGGVLSIELSLDRLPFPERELNRLLSPLMKHPYVRTILW